MYSKQVEQRILKVKNFFIRLKDKLHEVGELMWLSNSDYVSLIKAENIDTDTPGLLFQFDDGKGSSTYSYEPGFTDYEDADEFRKWFKELRNSFATITRIRI